MTQCSASPQRIKENLNIFDFALSDADVRDLDDLNKNIRYVKPDWNVFAK